MGAPYLAKNYTWSKKREEEEIKNKSTGDKFPVKDTQDAPLLRVKQGWAWESHGNIAFLKLLNVQVWPNNFFYTWAYRLEQRFVNSSFAWALCEV